MTHQGKTAPASKTKRERKTALTRRRSGAAVPTLPSDPVTRYARRVLEGEIVAGRAVRQACQRHLTDLGRQRTPEFPYYFDPVAAQHIIDFFPTFLTLEDGRPFVLVDWLQFSLGSVFGWKRAADGCRKYITSFWETGKGSSKSPAGGGVGLYGLTFEDRPYSEIYSAAFDKAQASIVLNDAIRMANASPDLVAEGLDVGSYNIANTANGSFFRAVSSEHRGKSGPRPHIVIGDEIHEQRDGRVITKMIAGFKGDPEPLALLLTNSGSDRTSFCWELHEKSLKVLEGSLVDEQWFAYVCHLDPCDECYRDGYRQPKDGCAKCDSWLDPAVWPKANPALGVVIQPKYLQDQVDRARSVPSEEALVKRLNFCLWSEAHTVWIPSDDWNACRVDQVATSLEGARAFAFDMSEKLDLTAGVAGIKTQAPPSEAVRQIEITDIDDGREVRKVFALDFYIDLVPFFWLPEKTMLQRIEKERMPWNVWRDQGHVRVTPGPVVDYGLIYEQFTQEIGPTYKPQRIGYDPHNATMFATQLRDKGRYEVAEIAQGRKLSEAFKLFEALVQVRRIRHAGNPVLSLCVANAEPRRDRYENLWVEKPSALKRIDGLIASVMAVSILMVLPMTSTSHRRGAKKWTPNGFVPA